ncbi:hypothetical protein L1049_000741 [Liquidambar formosana]|uniref:OPA3-like protein n=1 Tax=Liquidambar formosana TaxID=63359 RepID=A0AAP0NCX4_LIQFO
MMIVLKLGTLAIRTISKPIASRLKKDAGLHPRFREFIFGIAQANHRFTTTVQRLIYGHATDVVIRPLNEEKAIQAAADLLGEFFLFSVAGIALIFDVQRTSRAEARKEELRKQELEALRRKREDLEKEIQFLNQKLSKLEQLAKRRGFIDFFKFFRR